MKHLLIITLVIILAGLTFLARQDNIRTGDEKPKEFNIDYANGFLRNQAYYPSVQTYYNISAELFPERKTVEVAEEIHWTNNTSSPANEIQIHLYPNAFRNSKTLFARGRGVSINHETRSGVNLYKVKLDNKPVSLTYFQPEVDDKYDSTVAKIVLEKPLNPGESVTLHFEYILPVPKAMKRFGYAAGRNFFFISQWFPKPGVFKDGKWICSQFHPYTNFFSDFANYEVKITVPENYTIASTGRLAGVEKLKGGRKTYDFIQAMVHDFAWMATDRIIQKEDTYLRKDSTKVTIQAFIQPENEKYSERFIKAVKNSLEFFEENIGIYPYETISIVDAPKTSQSSGMEYPTLITVGAGLFSPKETIQPESVTIHEFAHQYFYGIIANNEVYEAWLDEGLASYITTKIAYKYYGQPLASFRLFGYYPVFGLEFIQYNELPLIYTLGDYPIPEGSYALSSYYQSPACASISDTSYKLPDAVSYRITAYSKPELMMLSLERYLGFNSVMNILKEYYNTYKFRHPSGEDFIKIVRKNTGENMDWFFNNLYSGASAFDYSVKSVKPSTNEGEYEVYCERLRDGVFKMDVALYTDKDTLYQKWDGNERWKKLIFRTNNRVTGAEIDPFRKNIMDLNYSNNSYLINSQFAGSISMSIRWLFWIQNLVLIMGSIA